VQEINRIVDITPVPNSPHYIEGVINLRGKVIPVINLRKRFGLDSKEIDNHSRIIVVDVGIVTGIIVDSVSEVLRISSDTIDPLPSMTGSIGSEYIRGVGKLNDRLLILIDIDRLFLNKDRLKIDMDNPNINQNISMTNIMPVQTN
jgi:purine-binding chemotaxis protein CheW